MADEKTPSRRVLTCTPLTQPLQLAVVKEGWGTKMGGMVMNWKRRWFRLRKDRTISYYETPNDLAPKGVIYLDGAQVDVCQRRMRSDFNYTFQIATPKGRTYFINVDSLAELRSWLQLLYDECPECFHEMSKRCKLANFQPSEVLPTWMLAAESGVMLAAVNADIMECTPQ